ncbi:Type 1 glutamine amidotransferase-like domain-containing protein [soil metagenome]
MESLSSRRRFRRTVGPAIIVALLTLLFPLLSAAQQENRALVPIGGGYSDATLQGFSRVVADNATGETVDIYVVPSTYGDSKDPVVRSRNIVLAEERTQQVEDACNLIVTIEISCNATLLMLFDRDEAMEPANSNALYNEETDGVFILGGDQTIAMEVLFETPAEVALTDAYERGVIVGGTSAGAAVESTNMIAGYTQPGWPYNALERPMITIWWENDDTTLRGLIFSSDEIIWDQHFYQRGRFTRLLNVTAQSDEQFGGASKLGVGVDVDTAVTLTNETLLENVFGNTSVTILDGETANTTFEWVGERETLSARNVRSHVMGAGDNVSYDVPTRTPFLDGNALALNAQSWSADLLRAPGRATLMLGGDLSYDWQGPAMADFLNRVNGNRPIVLVSADGNPAIGQNLVAEYSEGLREAGWTGEIKTLVYGDESQWNGPVQRQLAGAGGVIVVADDQSRLEPAIGDERFRSLLDHALKTAPVVLTDRSMTAAMGDWYVANPDPTRSDRQNRAIDAFKAGDANIQPGLGIVAGTAFQPVNTLDQHWGRIYSLTMAHPGTISFGISELTAIVLDRKADAHLAGERSVIALDGRAATYAVGDNGAFTAFNVMLDAFAPGDTLAANR